MENWLRVAWQRWLAIALLLVSLGINGCGRLSTPPSISQDHHLLEFVPRQSLLAAMVSTTLQAPGKVWQHSDLIASASQFAESLLTPLAIDFAQDIRPWLGNNIAVAITDKDLDRERRNGRQTGYLLVADIVDSERLREFLELFWQRQTVAGRQPIFAEVNGVPVITGSVAPGDRPLAIAVVTDNILLVANDIKVLRQSLRAAQTPTLQLSQPDCYGAAWVNVRIPEFVDWLGLATSAKGPLTAAHQWQQLTATARFNSQGFTVNTLLASIDTSIADTSITAPAELESRLVVSEPEQYLPTSIAWAAVGYDLRPLWTAIWEELGHYQKLPSLLEKSQRWQSTQLAQSLSEPLYQLLSRNYAVGQLDDGTWVMAMVATPAVTQLNEIARQQGLTVSQLTLNGQTVTAWSRLKTRVQNRETAVNTELVALHTKTDQYNLFATSIESLTAALAAPDHALVASQRFQHTVQSMEKPNQGYFYGTWSELERLLASNRWFSLVNPILQPWSQSIDAIAITSYGQNANQLTGTVSILLKK